MAAPTSPNATSATTIDSCEHLLEAGARLVLRLLEDLPDLTILTTSREALGIRGERVHLLAPLAVPEETEGLGTAEDGRGGPGPVLTAPRVAGPGRAAPVRSAR